MAYLLFTVEGSGIQARHNPKPLLNGRMLEHNESAKHYVVHSEVVLHGGHDLTIIDTITRSARGLPIKPPSFN